MTSLSEDMSQRFFTSDNHLGHPLVAADRGFDSVADHDDVVCDAWSDAVGKRDTVYVLGDVVIRNLDANLARLAKLPGIKHLIAGNHDGVHPNNVGAHRLFRRYAVAFESIASAGTVKIAGQRVLLSHFPYVGDHADRSDRYTQWRLPDEGGPLIHGHVHDEWVVRGRQRNVGIDTSIAPVSESAIAEWLRTLGGVL